MSIRIIAGAVILIALTLLTSIAMNTYQTNLENKSRTYSELIKKIPEKFGDWERTESNPLQEYAAVQLRVKDAEHWIYKNTQTGDMVGVSILVGPTGRLGVHRPEVCLSGESYVPIAERQRKEFKLPKDGGTIDHVYCWRVSFREIMYPDIQRVFYYGMGTGKTWWASDEPRFEFARYPFMLKVQAETVVPITQSPTDDAAAQFLTQFLPEVGKVFAETTLEEDYK